MSADPPPFKRHLHFEVPPTLNGLRLDQGLSHGLSEQELTSSRDIARKLIELGAVYIDRQRVDMPSRKLRTGSRVDVHYQHPVPDPVPPLAPDAVLYQDKSIIIVEKPSGLPTQASIDNSRDHLYALVTQHLAQRGVHYCGLHHRLDAQASGLVLFTTSKHANAQVARLFSEHRIERHYLALTAAPDPPFSEVS